MKQTAVEWLVNQYIEKLTITPAMVEQAKAMEKEHIKDAWINSLTKGDYNSAEQYYNETFKSENIVMFMTPENGEIESIILTDNPDCGVKGITFKSE